MPPNVMFISDPAKLSIQLCSQNYAHKLTRRRLFKFYLLQRVKKQSHRVLWNKRNEEFVVPLKLDFQTRVICRSNVSRQRLLKLVKAFDVVI